MPSTLPPDATGTLRPLLRLALPVLAEQSLWMLVGFSDQILTGWYLGRAHLAAVNLMVYCLWLLSSLFVVVTIGATAMTARFVGAGDLPLARQVLHQALLLGSLIAAAATIGGLVAGDRLLAWFQLEGESHTLALRYLSMVLPAVPLIMLESVGNACLRGAGDMITGLVAMIAVNVVNVLVSWALVQGWGPLEALGWDGVAIGTASGYVVGGLVIGWRLLAGRAGLQLSWRMLRPDLGLMRRLLRIGIPGGTDILSIIACQLWFVALINQLGDLAAAAHGVAIRIESLAYLPGSAFQVAAATFTGQSLGAGQPQRATRGVISACWLGCGLMSLSGLVFLLAADPLTRWFVRADQTEVIATAVPLLRIVSLAMPPLALTMILNGALRGAGDTLWPLLFSLIGYLLIRLPGTYFLAHYCGLGVAGAWYAMVADLMIRCLLVGGRFWQGGWQRVKV